MKTRPIQNDTQRQNAINAILKLPYPYELGVSKKLRTDGQNRRYWASLEEYLDQIKQAIDRVVDHTGYTPLEVRRLVAKELQPEQIAILFSLRKEVAHDVLKIIAGIPTSTRLNTKEFGKFEEQVMGIMIDIVGEVNNITRGMI